MVQVINDTVSSIWLYIKIKNNNNNKSSLKAQISTNANPVRI